jgi:glycopeptide antibiotics resistance protein
VLLIRHLNIKIITYIYIIALLLATVLPINGSGVLSNNYTLSIRWDYLLHTLVYVPVPILMNVVVKNRGKVIFFSILIAAGLEFLQMVIPFRSFNVNDLMANMIGVAMGITLLLAVRRQLKQ